MKPQRKLIGLAVTSRRFISLPGEPRGEVAPLQFSPQRRRLYLTT
jgi:hypothetical protein